MPGGAAAEPMSHTLDRTDFMRPRHVPGLELVSASYAGRSFPTHAHPEYVVGAITSGSERLTVGRRNAVLTAGDTLFLQPGEMHSNASLGTARLRYSVFYIPEGLLRETLPAQVRAPAGIPRFCLSHSSSAELHRLVADCHAALRSSDDALLQQSAFVRLAIGLAPQFGAAPIGFRVPDNPRVGIAVEYLREHFRLNPSLSQLAEISGLSACHLLRSFTRQVGLSPVAYRNLLRVMAARESLRSGEALAASAADAGFADQSHMTRAFQKVLGTPPGRYAQQERSSRTDNRGST